MSNYQAERFNCTLLSSCDERKVYSYPAKTSSGDKQCQPNLETEKRRPCRPACPIRAQYCHGRCYYFGKGCYHGVCSRRPYREDSGDTCSLHAMEAASAGGECGSSCSSSIWETELGQCQDCIQQHLISINASHCLDLSGASCWSCTTPVSENLQQCSETRDNPLEIVQCVQQNLQSGCRSCVCSLLCYWSAGGDLCRACLENAELETFFVNHEHCPQGWTWSEDAAKCFKGFSDKKSWSFARQTCKDGGGRLAEAKTNVSISNMIEAMNLALSDGTFWVNSKRNFGDDGFVWADNTNIESYSWAQDFPSQGDHCYVLTTNKKVLWNLHMIMCD